MFNNKLLPVLKATMTGEMNIFKVGKRKNKTIKNKFSRILFVFFIGTLIMFSVGSYAYLLADGLHKIGMTYLVITVFALLSTLFIFIQGLYQAQGILFETRDNDILFSMPIKKSTILASRLIKLLYFEYIWNFILMFPAFGVYAFFENPDFKFYISAFIVFICIPIIPMILSSVFGYIIQNFASRFKLKKMFQLIFTFAFTIVIFIFSFKINNWIENISQYAQSLNDILLKVYYPLGIYEQCLIEFSYLKLLYSLLGNLLIFILYVFIFSFSYSKIISRLSEKTSGIKYKYKKSKTKSKFKALFIKEIKRYFGSPIYVMNTIFGSIILIISAIYIVVSKNSFLDSINSEYGMILDIEMLSKFIIAIFMFALGTSTTTSSAISIEGKNFWFMKSLPVKTKQIFLAKILVNILITVPIAIISLIIYAIFLKMQLLDIVYCLLVSIILPFLVGNLGLVMNLKFPVLNAKSDTVVVKQSVSATISVFAGMALSILPIALYLIFKFNNISLYTGIVILIYLIITIILWQILNTYGVKRFKEINN